MKKILFTGLLLFLILSMTGCANRNRAVSFDDVTVERVGDTNTVMIYLLLYDGEGDLTQDRNVQFEISGKDFNDVEFDLATVEIEKEMIRNDYLVLFYIDIDESLATSNAGEMIVKAIFGDGSSETKYVDFDYKCSDSFDRILDLFMENGEAIPVSEDLNAYRIDIVENDGDNMYNYRFDVLNDGQIYVSYGTYITNEEFRVKSVKLKFNYTSDSTFNMLLLYSAQINCPCDLRTYGGTDEVLSFSPNGFDTIAFDEHNLNDEDMEMHLQVALAYAEDAIGKFNEYLMEHIGIHIN